MCAYNAEYGVGDLSCFRDCCRVLSLTGVLRVQIPSCANPLNDKLAREEWGWNGWFISDCGAIHGILNSHHYTSDPNSTIRAGMIQGGVDVNCGDANPAFYAANIPGAVINGSILETDLDRAAGRCVVFRACVLTTVVQNR